MSMLTREQVEQIRQRFEYGYAKPCYYDHGTQPAGMFIDHTEAFRDLKDMLAHDAEQRQTIEFEQHKVAAACEVIEQHKQTIEAQAQRIKELEAQLKAFEQDSVVCKLEAALGRHQEAS